MARKAMTPKKLKPKAKPTPRRKTPTKVKKVPKVKKTPTRKMRPKVPKKKMRKSETKGGGEDSGIYVDKDGKVTNEVTCESHGDGYTCSNNHPIIVVDRDNSIISPLLARSDEESHDEERSDDKERRYQPPNVEDVDRVSDADPAASVAAAASLAAENKNS